MFLKKKLLRKWFYNIQPAVSPETIIWENLGASRVEQVKMAVRFIVVVALAAFVSMYSLSMMAAVEKLR